MCQQNVKREWLLKHILQGFSMPAGLLWNSFFQIIRKIVLYVQNQVIANYRLWLISLGIREIPGQEIAAMSTYRKDTSPSIIRDLDKCIMCRRCEMMCNDVQTVGALSAVNRGFMATVAPAFEQNLEYSTCTYCGQCVSVCPTGALTEVNHTPEVLQSSCTIRQKLLLFRLHLQFVLLLVKSSGMEPGTLVTGKMTSSSESSRI